jgi:hypothetical protein
MTVAAWHLTEAQLDLVGFLIDAAIRDSAELERRWLKAAPFVRRRAEQGQLVLLREWGQTTVLTRAGDIVVVDSDDGSPDRPATERERRFALFQAIDPYPELLSLLPARPPEARTCSGCLGTGINPFSLTNPSLRNVICECGGAGWVKDAEEKD